MGNCGDGDGIQKKLLPKSKSPVQSGPSKDWKTPGERTGSGSVPTKEQLQNEYDWHSSQVTFKVDKVGLLQGFMQDEIIASHTCFGGHMDVNC